MIEETAYDDLSSVYDSWAAADPAARPSLDFYSEIAREEEGTIVELGIGTGRIALQLAGSGKHIVGLDVSERMLQICRKKAIEQGVLDRLKLIHGDMRNFSIGSPANLIYLPFRTLGHLLESEDRLNMLQSAYENLTVGGRLVFDHYIFDESWAKINDRKPRLMCAIPNSGGGITYIYDIYLYSFEKQSMDCRIAIELVDKSGLLIQKRYVQFDFSWLTPEQIRTLVSETDFQIDAIYGDFNCEKWTKNSENQIWVLRKGKQ